MRVGSVQFDSRLSNKYNSRNKVQSLNTSDNKSVTEIKKSKNAVFKKIKTPKETGEGNSTINIDLANYNAKDQSVKSIDVE